MYRIYLYRIEEISIFDLYFDMQKWGEIKWDSIQQPTEERLTRVNKEQTALMDFGNLFPHPTARCFFYDIQGNLTDLADIEHIEIETEVFWPASISYRS